jgi:hypothetical protein
MWGPSVVDKKTGKQRKITNDDIQLGCLQRIADALEKHDVLEGLAKDLQVKIDQKNKELELLGENLFKSTKVYIKFCRQIAGLKGHLGHLKKKGAK